MQVTANTLADYRRQTFRSEPGARLRSVQDAEVFVNERGFVFLYSIQGIPLPSLWVATAGDRPVASEHNDPGQVIWDWKDSSLGKRRWYYARLLRKRNTLISLAALPYFYALSPNYGDPEHDYLDQYQEGLMPHEAKLVYEALLQIGPMDTLALRQAARMAGDESTGRFNKAMDLLQSEFKIVPVGISNAGAWKYAFIFDMTHRHYPTLIDEAGKISEGDARDQILTLYFRSIGAASLKELNKLFPWRPDATQRSLNRLIQSGLLTGDVSLPIGTGYALTELVTE
jgi:hypothetical protein